jgi:hypothetical protein
MADPNNATGSIPDQPSAEASEKAAAEALTAFKDWSNYLLVTTVAAVGWIATDQTISTHFIARWLAGWLLCTSIVFGIFTLALVPSSESRYQNCSTMIDIGCWQITISLYSVSELNSDGFGYMTENILNLA